MCRTFYSAGRRTVTVIIVNFRFDAARNSGCVPDGYTLFHGYNFLLKKLYYFTRISIYNQGSDFIAFANDYGTRLETAERVTHLFYAAGKHSKYNILYRYFFL